MNVKPCPFCGQKAVQVKAREIDESRSAGTLYQVKCPDCWGSGGESLTQDGATASWNSRAPNNQP